MTVSRAWAILHAAVAMAVIATQASAAAPSELRKQVAELFDAGWHSGAAPNEAADEKYQTARRIAPGDLHVEQAWALVLIKQRRYDAALDQLDKILKQKPGEVSARMWKARIRTLTRKHAAALVELEQLAATLPTDQGATEEAAAQLATARFIGRTFGYLQGPAELPANLRDDTLARLTAKFTPAQRAAFDEGRAAVFEQFADLNRQKEQSRAEARRRQETAKVQQQDQLDAKRSSLENELAGVAAEFTRLREDERRELADHSREVRQAESSFTQAERRLAVVLQQWDQIQLDRQRAILAMDAEADPVRRELWGREVARFDVSLVAVDAKRRLRETDVLRARDRLADLARGGREIERRYRNEIASLQDRESAARKQQSRLEGDQKKIDRPISASSPRDRNLATRAAAYTTYEVFPLDLEKERLLQSLH